MTLWEWRYYPPEPEPADRDTHEWVRWNFRRRVEWVKDHVTHLSEPIHDCIAEECARS